MRILLICLFSSLLCLDASSSSLTIYAYPPSQALDWRSPKSALKSFLGIELRKQLTKNDHITYRSPRGEKGSLSSNYLSTMGHTLAHIKCQLPSGEEYESWSSFSGQNYIELDKKNIFKDKLGLGSLFYDYPDGHIIEGEENIKRITHYKGHRKSSDGSVRARPRYLAVEINAQACARLQKMVSFFQGFHFPSGTPLERLLKRPQSETLYFNSTLDSFEAYLDRQTNPNSKMGGGCAPYGAALLKMAGRYDSHFDKYWKLRIPVSERLIGSGPSSDLSSRREVGLGALLFGDLGSQWQWQGYADRKMEVFDPQKIWSFMGEIAQCLENNCGPRYQDWWQKNRHNLEKGPTKIFRDKYVKTVLHQTYKSAPTHKKVLVRVEQPVSGFVWRLE